MQMIICKTIGGAFGQIQIKKKSHKNIAPARKLTQSLSQQKNFTSNLEQENFYNSCL